MQKQRYASPVEQLELEFNIALAASKTPPSIENNVVHVQFGLPKSQPSDKAVADRVLIERILQSAQRLRW